MPKIDSMAALERVPQPMGPRIRVARENAGLSRAEMARRLGVTEKTIRSWENDVVEPRANRLHMLAGILNVSLTWFLEGREDEYMAEKLDPEEEALRSELAEIRTRLDELLGMVSNAEKRLASGNH